VNSSWSSPKPVPVGLPVDGFKTGGFTTLVGGAFGFAASAFAFAAASAFAFAAVAAAALSFDAEVLIDFFSAATCAGVLETFGLDVNLSINNFVPAPIAAPVSAFVIPLEVELDGLLVEVRVCLGTPVVLVVIDGLVPDVELLVIEGLDDVPVPKLVVNEGLEPPVDVMALELPLLTFGALLAPLTTLLSGARVSAFASGICLLDVRFLRIAIFYPLFFTSDVKVAMSVIGLNFAPLAKVFDGATRVVGAAF
jgi:hypothetical protein